MLHNKGWIGKSADNLMWATLATKHSLHVGFGIVLRYTGVAHKHEIFVPGDID